MSREFTIPIRCNRRESEFGGCEGVRKHLHDNGRPKHLDFRKGDVLHSRAKTGKATRLLGYAPTRTIDEGLDAPGWCMDNLS